MSTQRYLSIGINIRGEVVEGKKIEQQNHCASQKTTNQPCQKAHMNQYSLDASEDRKTT